MIKAFVHANWQQMWYWMTIQTILNALLWLLRQQSNILTLIPSYSRNGVGQARTGPYHQISIKDDGSKILVTKPYEEWPAQFTTLHHYWSQKLIQTLRIRV